MYVDDTGEAKKRLRSEYRRIRGGISSDIRNSLDGKIRENLLSSEEYRQCDTLLTYVSVSGEADTRGIISAALSDGKTVAVPRCKDGAPDMEFYVIDSVDRLVAGAFSVPEPSPGECRRLDVFSGALCIVPALAYDAEGYRLGYGKGYYDRFLSSHGELYKIGIEYSCCVCDALVRGRFDIPADMLITESYVKIIRKQEA